MKVGFIGLGIMGSAMAANLLKGGFSLTVWNRTSEKGRELVERGALWASSPRDVVLTSDITFAMLADPAAAKEVCFCPNGVLEGISQGKGYVDMSTVDEWTSREIDIAVRKKGGLFMEAPVSGSRKPAEEGTLIILCAGDRSLYEYALPALNCMGKKVLFLGEVGKGARMKLTINMIMGGMMAIFCEGLALGKRAGLDVEDILEVIDAGAMANPMFRFKGSNIKAGQYEPAFPLKHMQKDLRLALLMGEHFNQSLPVAAVANESFKRAKELGYGDEDFSAVYKVIDAGYGGRL